MTKTVADLIEYLHTLILRIKQKTCKHKFDIRHLEMVNRNGLNDRVKWPCAKCGKVFRAHCGLDISPKYGETFRE